MRVCTQVKRAMKKKVHVFYSGRVQGVGFRMTAEECARALGATGWVKNLPDGRVEMIAEAEEAELFRLLEQIRNGSMKNFITHVDASWSVPNGHAYTEFTIRYY